MSVFDMLLPAAGLYVAIRWSVDAIKLKKWRELPIYLGIGVIAISLGFWMLTTDRPRASGGCYTDWDGRSNPTVCP